MKTYENTGKLENAKILECIEWAIAIQYAIIYDDNISAPTITAKENIFKCIVAMYTKNWLSLKQKIGLWLLLDGTIPMKRKK